MTEQEWQECEDVQEMWYVLQKRTSPWRWSTRKARLFSCACCRRIWSTLKEQDQRDAVEASERAADKQISLKDLTIFHQATRPIQVGAHELKFSGGIVYMPGHKFWLGMNNGQLLCNPGKYASFPIPWGSPSPTANDCLALLYYRNSKKKSLLEQRVQSVLFRDIVGPITLPVLKPGWLTANDNAVTKLTQKIYDKRTFGQLPKIADALQAAGCKDKLLLEHLRSRGPHARGCWAVDLLLGKS